MTSRTFNVTILRTAAVLVPAPRRADWLAEWNAEVCYIDRDATAFCLGSFRDALWLRCHNPGAIRRMFSVDSPLRCVLFLVSLVALTLSLIFPLRKFWRASWASSILPVLPLVGAAASVGNVCHHRAGFSQTAV